ncbi:type VI secretion protein IcmF/TssM N-terminal domain-containing protein [Oceanibaculum pacificum]|uniref:Type VI secretion system component TssM1 N-terminal domain-containing protein n=1 Tax=Oceanibaculum pacificum TaxID=580166 RepID=A0A154VMW7_9PROT|nr:type VI secretion protein IcmF/TssM N-terminal domain-containing protein [Oceanibaculum pacificum]KZD02666.1 hypothetical protein AUP43_13585 [Oceanibaculum pacificum]
MFAAAWSHLAALPGWAWALLGLLGLALLAGALWWWRTHRKPADTATDTTGRALAALRQAVPNADRRAALPWIVRIGPSLPGLNAVHDLQPAFVEPAHVPGDGAMRWWGFPGGVVIDMPAAEAPFHAALAALAKARPNRPMDGLLLDIDLSPAADAPALRRQMIAAAQAAGLRLPVYLALSGAEALPGFADFAAALPSERWADMLGWSAPVGLDAAYDPAWPAEALAQIGAGLSLATASMFGEDADLADPAAIYRLPEAVAALEPALDSLAGTIFSPGVEPPPYGLRGLYLAGADQGRMLFLADLLRRKAFAEIGLATPLPGDGPKQGWTLRALQAAVAAVLLIGTVGIAVAGWHLSQAARDIAAIVEQLDSDLARIDSSPADLPAMTRRLVTAMEAAESDRLSYAFLPLSWFDPLSRPLGRAAEKGFERIVLAAVTQALRAEADAAIATPTSAAPAKPAGLEKLPAYLDLAGYLAGLETLEARIALYDQLAGSQAATALSSLLQQLLGVTLAPEIVQQRPTLLQALASARRREGDFPIALYRPKATARLDALLADFYRAAYGDNALGSALAEAATRISILAGPASATKPAALPALRQALDRVTGLVSSGDAAYLAADPAADPQVTLIWQQIGGLRLLGGAVQGRVISDWTRNAAAARNGLLGLSSPGYPSFVTLDQKGPQVTLDADLSALAAALDQLYAQPFMAAGSGARLPAALPADGSGFWDPAATATAQAAAGAYATYRAKPPAGIAPPLDREVPAIAGLQAAASIEALLADALLQRDPAGQTLASMQGEVGAFAAVTTPLEDTLAALFQSGLNTLRLRLGGLLRSQADGLLARTDRLQLANAAYATVDGDRFAWWDGQGALGYRGFGVDSQAAMQGLLTQTQAYIGLLDSQLAAPVLDFIVKAGANLPPGSAQALETKWTGIATALAAIQAKQPAGSVASLNSFVLETMPAITLAGCGTAIPAAQLAATPADYFDTRRLALMRGIAQRCDALAGEAAGIGYNRLVAQFRTRVEGKFPFAAADQRLEASAADLMALLTAYDALPAGAAALLQGQGRGDQAEFVAAIGGVRALFPGFGASGAPSLGLLLTPRANRAYETGGNRLIGWRIAIGDQAVEGVPAAATPLVWSAGDPVTVTLRFAANGPYRPAPTGQQLAAGVSGESVAYSFGGQWAVLRAWRAQRGEAADFPPGSTARDTTWRFVMPTVTRTAPADPTRVFIAAVPFAPTDATRAPLALPAFPITAPDP